MTLLVDTSVWSLALRRGRPADLPELTRLSPALSGRDLVAMTGVVLQEILQGVVAPASRAAIVERFAPLAYLMPIAMTTLPPLR
ncbi:MAG TPA: hypothetical protein PKH97_08360 [Tetrasphaera sp.]|uniref:hypothetical protein n=1 Tax=Nostocoides sp. TaxID=1917966 RepID=UPI002BF3D5ED|nr:hypothetical protein [Tetrasphaera sp.]HNQ07182.1 hypothetical protein [Tetrasphaera sp.]